MPNAMDLTIDSITQPLAEWALDYGIPCALIRNRLEKGWSAERAVTEPMRKIAYRLTPADMKDLPKPSKIIEHDGKAMTVRQWAAHLGINQQVITYRLRQNYPIPMVLDAELRRGKRPPDTRH